MNDKALAQAYADLTRHTDDALAAFTGAVAQSGPTYDTEVLNTALAAHVENQRKIAALLLLPRRYPELIDKVPELQALYRKVAGTTRTPWEHVMSRSQQYEAMINAAVKLILSGKPFKLYHLVREVNASEHLFRTIFRGGFNEVRELALERIIATTLAYVGVPDPLA